MGLSPDLKKALIRLSTLVAHECFSVKIFRLM